MLSQAFLLTQAREVMLVISKVLIVSKLEIDNVTLWLIERATARKT